MLFNSWAFALFFPTVVCLYFLIPHRFRWAFLLAASYFFYMCWKVEYVFLIMISTLIDYLAGIWIFRSSRKWQKKLGLICSLVGNLGLLFLFKYFDFFTLSANSLMSQFGLSPRFPQLRFLLPVGISFYTFQSLSYTIDIYWGLRKPVYHLGIFALYVSFFPQLVAGPIERSTHLLPQFFEKKSFEFERICQGLAQMLFGFFKKMVLADNLAFFVNGVYGHWTDFSGGTLLLATYLFAFQIYYDFAGYSDIAIGAGRVLGYELSPNFTQPYFAKSVSEFWRRWHMTLSFWFRDYLYIPLGGSRVSPLRWGLNVIIVFLLCGLWHGANWTFVFWGGLHGLFLILEQIRDKFFLRKAEKQKTPYSFKKKAVTALITFHCVCFSWIFFRAQSLSSAFAIVGKIFDGLFRFDDLSEVYKYPGVLIFWGILILLTEIIHYFIRTDPQRFHEYWQSDKRTVLKWGFYYLIIFTILVFGNFNQQEFIYFQF